MAWHRLWFELLRQKGFVNNIIDIVNPHFFLEILYISDICMYYVYWITYILDHGGQIASPVLWSANLLPLLLLLLFLLLLLLLLLLLISQPPPPITTSTVSTTFSTATTSHTEPRSAYHPPDHIDRASFYRLITSCPVHRIVDPLRHATIALYRALTSPPIPASHRWVLKLSILSQYHTHWVVMHVSKLAEIKIEIKINDIYLNITHIGMGRFVMHVSRLTTW